MSSFRIAREFRVEQACLAHLEEVRWAGEPACPYCRSRRTTARPSQRRHHCNACNTTFSVTVGTIFHRTRLPLRTWFKAVAHMLDPSGSISVRRLATELGVNRNTAWRISAKVREAMTQPEERTLLQGLAELGEKSMRVTRGPEQASGTQRCRSADGSGREAMSPASGEVATRIES